MKAFASLFALIGLRLWRAGGLRTALRCYDVALRFSPEELAWRYRRGHILMSVGDYERAREDWAAFRGQKLLPSGLQVLVDGLDNMSPTAMKALMSLRRDSLERLVWSMKL